jgi:O-acetyl-ADP-ribose deacetylase (regulator of RNase III)
VTLLLGQNILECTTDAIVNAANSGLYPGSGLCGQIFEAAGHAELTKACRALRGCQVGSSVVTPGFRLRPFIIHAVGPDCRVRQQLGRRQELLASAYRSILAHAGTCQPPIRTIALCCLCAGIYQCGHYEANEVAMNTVKEWLSDPNPHPELEHVYFAVSGEYACETFRWSFPRIFPGARICPGPVGCFKRYLPRAVPPPPQPEVLQIARGGRDEALATFKCPHCHDTHDVESPLWVVLTCPNGECDIAWEVVANGLTASLRRALLAVSDAPDPADAALQVIGVFRQALGARRPPTSGDDPRILDRLVQADKLWAYMQRPIDSAFRVHGGTACVHGELMHAPDAGPFCRFPRKVPKRRTEPDSRDAVERMCRSFAVQQSRRAGSPASLASAPSATWPWESERHRDAPPEGLTVDDRLPWRGPEFRVSPPKDPEGQ